MQRLGRRIIFSLIAALTLTACGGGGDGDSANYIPSIQIECSSGLVGDCSLNAKFVYTGLIENLAMDCDSTLKALNASQRQALFTVSGSATSSRNGIYLIATINSWTNSTGGRQDIINPGSYRVCSFVDSNGNGQLDSAEPVGSGQVNAGDNNYILNSWVAGS
jgi:hypothetical protein